MLLYFTPANITHGGVIFECQFIILCTYLELIEHSFSYSAGKKDCLGVYGVMWWNLPLNILLNVNWKKAKC